MLSKIPYLSVTFSPEVFTMPKRYKINVLHDILGKSIID